MDMFMFLSGDPWGYTDFNAFLHVAAFEGCESVLKIEYNFQLLLSRNLWNTLWHPSIISEKDYSEILHLGTTCWKMLMKNIRLEEDRTYTNLFEKIPPVNALAMVRAILAQVSGAQWEIQWRKMTEKLHLLRY